MSVHQTAQKHNHSDLQIGRTTLVSLAQEICHMCGLPSYAATKLVSGRWQVGNWKCHSYHNAAHSFFLKIFPDCCLFCLFVFTKFHYSEKVDAGCFVLFCFSAYKFSLWITEPSSIFSDVIHGQFLYAIFSLSFNSKYFLIVSISYLTKVPFTDMGETRKKQGFSKKSKICQWTC